MERLWCGKCGRGIDGVKNAPCPQCIRDLREPPGILMTPKEAEEAHLIEAKAIIASRKENIVKGHKGMDEMAAEIKADILKEIKENYDLIPKKKVNVAEVKDNKPGGFSTAKGEEIVTTSNIHQPRPSPTVKIEKVAGRS